VYPLNLELQYQQFFVREFRRAAVPFTRSVIQKLKEEIKADSDTSVRADSFTNLIVFLEKLKKQYGETISREDLVKEARKNFKQIDAWSKSKTAEVMAKNYERLNTPQPPSVTGRPAPAGKAGELWMQVINLRNNHSEELINKTVLRNVGLINKAYKSHFDNIAKIVKDGVLSGEGHRSIAGKIMDATGVSESKAKFWARDQASKFFGETTKLNQKAAGNKGYIWRCFNDNLTRDTHRALDGTYHDWDNPPVVTSGRKARRCHPGEDYNCRCWADPAYRNPAEAKTAQYKEPEETAAELRYKEPLLGGGDKTVSISGTVKGKIKTPEVKAGFRTALSLFDEVGIKVVKG